MSSNLNMTSRSSTNLGAARECRVTKVDDTLGIVYGYGIVCKVDGADYYDLQGDHIPEDEMLRAVADFMERVPTAKVMHEGEDIGRVLMSMTLTSDVAAAFDIVAKKTGWLVGWKPSDKAVVKRFQPGPNGEEPELTGFSIGGTGERHPVTP